MAIKAVVFDFFGVISSDPSLSFAGSAQQIHASFNGLDDQVNLGKINWQDFLEKIAKAKQTNLETIKNIYASEQINPQISALIDKLHQDYKTALLSNAHYEYIDKILALAHLEDLFDEIVISSRVGIIKPDPRIFELVLHRLDTDPEETLFIDDQIRNVDAARSLNIKAVLYESYDQLVKILPRYLS